MKTGMVSLSQIINGKCPNGHRLCLVAGCWLKEKKDDPD